MCRVFLNEMHPEVHYIETGYGDRASAPHLDLGHLRSSEFHAHQERPAHKYDAIVIDVCDVRASAILDMSRKDACRDSGPHSDV